jgi:hypothetical protein
MRFLFATALVASAATSAVNAFSIAGRATLSRSELPKLVCCKVHLFVTRANSVKTPKLVAREQHF